MAEFLRRLGNCKNAKAVLGLFFPQVNEQLRLAMEKGTYNLNPEFPPPGMPIVLGDLTKQLELVPEYAKKSCDCFPQDLVATVGQELQAFFDRNNIIFYMSNLLQWS